MNLEQMHYGANAPMEFNAGYERAEEKIAAELEELKKALEDSRAQLVKAREEFTRLQNHEAFSMTRTLYPLIESLGAMLAPVIEKKIKESLELEIDRRIKDQTDIDRELVSGWIRDELENTELFYSANEIDEKFSDFADNIDIDDAVENYLAEHLADEVRDSVQDLRFTVEVR